MAVFGGIEAGGTKFNLLIASGPDDIRAELRVPTTTPRETLSATVAFFNEYQQKYGEKLAGLGIGSFGPLDLNPKSSNFGNITSTPKPGWQNAALLSTLEKELELPSVIDTDVNAAAMGEAVWGAGQGLTDFLYFTIGTGVGGGAIINGRPLHGMIHPEMGHIPLAHDWQADPYKGRCPYHRDCFEGLTAGPAMKERWGVSAETLPLDHAAWQLEAHYIAMAMNVFAYSFSPQRIILGGGVMQQLQLFPMIRKEMLELLNGYIQAPAILEHIDTYLVPPMLGGKAGMLGCIALAKQAFEK